MTCAGCGCVCDDGRTCALGDAWFALGERPPVARVDGREVSLDEAVAAAAAILRAARAPLVYGLGQTSCEAQRRAVGLAEALGAVIDPGGPAPFAYQTIGASTATFGEIRDRAELVVAWRADPVVTHPRLLERLRVRSLVVVDATRTATAEQAEEFIQLDDDFEALWELRAGARTRRRSNASRNACARCATSPSSTAGSTISPRWRWPRSCATSAATATPSRSGCAARATHAAPRTCSPGRPASPGR